MIESFPFETIGDEREAQERERFLTSHRALAICAREFGRLADEITDRVVELGRELGIDEAPETRLTPERCIVQLGPVALTVAWLRSTIDSVAEGRLLVIAWQGTVAKRRMAQAPERSLAAKATQTAVPVWEETLAATGVSEETWAWRPESDENQLVGSTELATRCVKQLRSALASSIRS